MSDIVLYTNPQSRGFIVHWMLEELGEPYDTVWIEYGEQMKDKAYLAINPMGKVPAITHKGTVVTEVAAICTFLAAAYPERGLIPGSVDAGLADFYRWMFFASGPMEAATTAHSMGWEVPAERERMVGFGTYQDTMNTLELALAGRPFICGEQFTAVDVYLGSGLNWGMLFGTVEKRPQFEEYIGRLIERPAFQRTDQLNKERI